MQKWEEKNSLSFAFYCQRRALKSSAGRHNQTLGWLHPSLHTQEPRHTIAPMLLLYSKTDNCIPKALLRLRNIPLCIGSPTYNVSHVHTHYRDYCMFSYIWPWLQKPSCVCVCWQCCLSASDLTVELCFYRLHRFTCSAAGRLKDKREGVVSRGGWGGWVTYHLMLPLLHNPTLSNGGKLLMKPRSRTIEDRKRKGREGGRERGRGETALFFGVSMQTPDKASLPFFTKFVFSRLGFWLDQHSNERLQCPKAPFESPKK